MARSADVRGSGCASGRCGAGALVRRGEGAVAVQRRAGRTQLRTLPHARRALRRVDAGGAGLRGHPVPEPCAAGDDDGAVGLPAGASAHPLGALRRGAPARRRGAVPPGNAGEARGGRRAQSLRVLGRQPEPRARGRNGRHREPGIGGIREGRRSLCGSLRGKSAHLPVRHRRRARSPRAALHRRESRARYHGALVRRERH